MLDSHRRNVFSKVLNRSGTVPSLPWPRQNTETQSEQQASVYQFCHLYKGANQESEKERARGESGQQQTKMHTGVKASTQMLPSVWPSIAVLAQKYAR